MTEILRTDDRHFDALTDWPYEPRYHQWKDVRIHYVDEGPADGPVMLLLHGMPMWGYLYRDMIPAFVAAGYRCIVPDHAGFGRSDKQTDAAWYSIARHTEILTSLVTALDLQHVTMLVQDWGGPTGLAQAATMPERFDRLVIMKTRPGRNCPTKHSTAHAGFPSRFPHNDYDSGNDAAQTAHFRTLLAWDKPVHFVWGGSDGVFTSDWGRSWAAQMQATFDEIPEATHFLQDTHGARIADLVLGHIG